nr:MAG TPA: hypothetical protein [Caudoviricetes sp.]
MLFPLSQFGVAGNLSKHFSESPLGHWDSNVAEANKQVFYENSKRCISGYKRTFTGVLTDTAKLQHFFQTTKKTRQLC